ncbi:MAG TPA: AzlD domain-containing protein [Ktedonosporobacter sp.]|nr:AzlD domain-containing protein [Ktedonosporobacter sp.]
MLWITIISIGLLTFGIRLSFIVFMGKTQVAPMLQQALRFVPVAVLSALIAPALFLPKGSLDLSVGNIRLIAGLLAILVAWRTKNILLTIVVGMACLLILQMLISTH